MEQSRLAMVNSLLVAIGETAVQTIDLTHPDIQTALTKWDEQSALVQTRGWWYNREEYQLTVDPMSGEVFLPSGLLELDAVSTNYVQRGRRLYDLTNHTYLFDIDTVTAASLVVGCIMDVALEDLPPIIYKCILLLAKIDIITDIDADTIKLDKLNREYSLCNAQALKADLRYLDPNRYTVNNAQRLLQAQSQR